MKLNKIINVPLIVVSLLSIYKPAFAQDKKLDKDNNSNKTSSIKKIENKTKEATKDIKKKIKNPNYPTKEKDIIIKKGSKIDNISKKAEKAKKELYEYIDDDVRPLTLLWMPCMNLFWSSNGEKVKETKSWGLDCMNFIRFMVMYDIQLGNSHFFLSPGIGWANQDYVFEKNCLYQPLKEGAKVEFKKAHDLIKERFVSGDNIDKGNYIKEKDIKAIGLHTNYFEVLTEIQFRSNKIYYKEGLFLALGLKLGYLFTNPKSFVTFVDTNVKPNETKQYKMKEAFSLNSYKVAMLFRFGLGSFGGFIEMTLNNILVSEKMEEKDAVLKPITFGISIDLI
ncbi:MAG: hypothetical protein GY830_02000 [Bacteroidetes bacterium]|nr:hypothetical protein [Bacteroidota bacterium]